MKNTVFPFHETQHFPKGWIWLVIALTAIGPGVVIYYTFLEKQAVEPADYLPAILISVTSVAVILLLLSIRLETTITPEAIHYRFFPVHRTTRVVFWNQLSEIYVREYSPLVEYGGWGIRIAVLSKAGIALNVSGKTGIQLVFTNGKRLLIGTQKGEQVQQLFAQHPEIFQQKQPS